MNFRLFGEFISGSLHFPEMAAAAARKQDGPPPGGYRPLDFSRIPARKVIGGKLGRNPLLTVFKADE